MNSSKINNRNAFLYLVQDSVCINITAKNEDIPPLLRRLKFEDDFVADMNIEEGMTKSINW